MTGLGWALSAGGLVSLVCLVVAVYYRGELQRARLALREADEDEHDWEAARLNWEERLAASENLRHASIARYDAALREERARLERARETLAALARAGGNSGAAALWDAVMSAPVPGDTPAGGDASGVPAAVTPDETRRTPRG